MKKIKLNQLLVVLLLAVFGLAGCSRPVAETEPAVTESTETAVQRETETTTIQEIQPETVESETETETESASIDQTESQETENTTSEVALTEEELASFTEFIQRLGNSCFLIPSYNEPQEIDLHEVLYNGIYGQQGEMTAAEEEAFHAAEAPGDVVDTDITSFSATELDEYLYEKTGLHYEEMNTPLNWIYLPEYDKYYSEHGDTNGAPDYTCVSGTRQGDLIYLDCVMGESYSTRVTLRESGDRYLFVANTASLQDQMLNNIPDESNAAVDRSIELYEAIYQDSRIFQESAELPERYCRITISNVTDTTFNFMIDQFNPETSSFDVIFMENTAIFNGDGRTAVYNGQQYTLNFTFPDVTAVAVSGFEPTKGVIFSHNAVPGNEF